MNTEKVYSLYFSPTGTTEKVVNAMAAGTGLPFEKINLTNLKKRQAYHHSFPQNDLVIAAMPVYGGRLPKDLDNFFSGLKGNGAPAVAVVVYGNREYDDALIEMKIRLEERGFRVVAGAVFLGEHTFSKKVAAGRPNDADLKAAEEFGKKVITNIDKALRGTLTVKGNYPYVAPGSDPLKMGPIGAVAIVTATEDCTLCGICAEECPWGAISIGNKVTIEYARCLRCLRCMRICPEGALKIDNPEYYTIITKFEEWLSERHRDPEFFFPE